MVKEEGGRDRKESVKAEEWRMRNQEESKEVRKEGEEERE